MLKAWPVRTLLPVAFLFVFASVSRMTDDPPRYLIGAVALLAAAIVWVASYDGDYLLPPGQRAACWMGSRSYGLYLIHVPAYLATRELWFRLSARDLCRRQARSDRKRPPFRSPRSAEHGRQRG